MWNSASGPAGCQTVQHLRSTRPRAVWLLLTECHDPKISAFSLTGGFEIPGLKVLWDYISEGFCDDGSWQVLLSSGWRNSAECLYCRELERIASTKHEYGELILLRLFIISCFFISIPSDWIRWLIKMEVYFRLNSFQTVLNKIYTHITVSINVRTLEMHFPSLK